MTLKARHGLASEAALHGSATQTITSHQSLLTSHVRSLRGDNLVVLARRIDLWLRAIQTSMIGNQVILPHNLDNADGNE
jgi:hypothetical protein